MLNSVSSFNLYYIYIYVCVCVCVCVCMCINIKNAGACSIYLDSVGCQVILMNTKILKIHPFVAKKNAMVTFREKTIQHYQDLTNTKS